MISKDRQNDKMEMLVMCAVSWTEASLFAIQASDTQWASRARVNKPEVDSKNYILKKA